MDFCWENGWPISFYSAEELSRVRGDFTPSDFVESVTGVDNVCERAALTGAKELIVKKTAIGDVTIAIAAENVSALWVSCRCGNRPGNYENMTVGADQALQKADVIVGYHVYVDLIKERYPEKEFITTPMS